MVGGLKLEIRGVANRSGYPIRLQDASVDLVDAYAEKRRTVGSGAKVFFDVGAHDGRDWLRYAELFPNATMYALEPEPESFAYVKAKAASCPRIVAVNATLSDKSGEAESRVSNWVDSISLMKLKSTGTTFDAYQTSTRSISVTINTIDAVCTRTAIDRIEFLKIDVQGAELKMLFGARDMLERGAIEMVFSEVHFLESFEGAARSDQIMTLMVEDAFLFQFFYGLNHNHPGADHVGRRLFRGPASQVLKP